MMRLILSGHVRYRLMIRDLGESDLEEIMRRKQKPSRDKDGNPIYRGVVRGIAVAVVIRAGSQPPFVITVYLD
ncbi:MAG: hypothetical protein ACR2M3_11600 [Thermomicrobiales bacterium]